MVSEDTKLVECGIFLQRNTDSNTIIIHLYFMNKWVTPVTSVTSKVALDLTFVLILSMAVFVGISGFAGFAGRKLLVRTLIC